MKANHKIEVFKGAAYWIFEVYNEKYILIGTGRGFETYEEAHAAAMNFSEWYFPH